jgi:hypothetical protein
MKTQLIYLATKHWCYSNTGKLCECRLDSACYHMFLFSSLQFPKLCLCSRYRMYSLISPWAVVNSPYSDENKPCIQIQLYIHVQLETECFSIQLWMECGLTHVLSATASFSEVRTYTMVHENGFAIPAMNLMYQLGTVCRAWGADSNKDTSVSANCSGRL